MLTSTQRLYLELGWISEALCVCLRFYHIAVMWEREGHFCPVIPCWPSIFLGSSQGRSENIDSTQRKPAQVLMLTFSITFAVKELFCWDLLLLETKSKVAAMALLVFEETSNFPTLTHTHCREEGGLAYTSSS